MTGIKIAIILMVIGALVAGCISKDNTQEKIDKNPLMEVGNQTEPITNEWYHLGETQEFKYGGIPIKIQADLLSASIIFPEKTIDEISDGTKSLMVKLTYVDGTGGSRVVIGGSPLWTVTTNITFAPISERDIIHMEGIYGKEQEARWRPEFGIRKN